MDLIAKPFNEVATSELEVVSDRFFEDGIHHAKMKKIIVRNI